MPKRKTAKYIPQSNFFAALILQPLNSRVHAQTARYDIVADNNFRNGYQCPLRITISATDSDVRYGVRNGLRCTLRITMPATDSDIRYGSWEYRRKIAQERRSGKKGWSPLPLRFLGR